ncbi:sn-glycerol-3-phosphate ABC transporter ATP-binding protein UgpC [Microvirga tunisiensis]|uniref:Sn-glycerol-3-phosphate ABC transporter ATP-binding protein UgpC n=1 Tax=Pannonibacter tanglangensis TaxID=2750084 RepID=A0A7X5F4F9_9HYPH|nr:sn-glycerol-3-phosphate ABC transporter ATP-binding protein UgpC [Pannonibacter sp. XCT-53]
MGQLKLNALVKRFGSAEVIRSASLDIANGEFVVFVGPSGCGKSTLLRMIAGLEDVSGGTIEIDGRVVNDLAPVERGIAMVFQSYALYPHMTVYENIAFPLRVAKAPQAEVDRRVRQAAEVLQLTTRLEHRPGQLSGGQRQRVAIGRAIVREPRLFLFDEPLSNLDAALRAEMRLELSRLHAQLGNTMIYVTHDQVEAMTMADRIVVLQGGVIEQVGTPLELYHKPANRFVAGFIGNPKMNFLPATGIGTCEAGARLRLFNGLELVVPVDGAVAEGESLTLGIRPDDLHPSDVPGLGVVPEVVERLGNVSICYAAADGGTAVTLVAGGLADLARGKPVNIGIDPHHCHVFRADGQALPRRFDITLVRDKPHALA